MHFHIPQTSSVGTDLLREVGPDTWRLTAASGRVLGNIVAVPTAQGERFMARRYHVPTRTHLELGQFWARDDAILALKAR